jgi:hypothetical protein
MSLDEGMSKASSSIGKSITMVGVVLSLAMIVTAGWLWHRSLQHADLLARIEPAPASSNERELTGVGSYKGAVLIGSIKDPPAIFTSAAYAHSVFPVTKGKGSLLHIVPETKRGKFGFGFSRGELRLALPAIPLLFWMKAPPPSEYRVVYVPYYFFMLLGIVLPARVGWRVLGMGRSGPAGASLRLQEASAATDA